MINEFQEHDSRQDVVDMFIFELACQETRGEVGERCLHKWVDGHCAYCGLPVRQ